MMNQNQIKIITYISTCTNTYTDTHLRRNIAQIIYKRNLHEEICIEINKGMHAVCGGMLALGLTKTLWCDQVSIFLFFKCFVFNRGHSIIAYMNLYFGVL